MHVAALIVFVLSAALLLAAGLVSVLHDLLDRSPHEAPGLIDEARESVKQPPAESGPSSDSLTDDADGCTRCL